MVPARTEPTMVGNVRYFEWFAPIYDLLMPRADRADIQSGLDLATRPVERVLDLGGGTGRAIREVTATDRLVVDPAIGMLRRVPAGVTRLRGSAPSLPLADDSIDAVLVVDALHHMPPADEVLAEIHRVLRPGGVAVVIDFDPTTVRGRLLVGAEHLVGFASVFYSLDDLMARMEDCGFEPQVVDPGFGYVVGARVPRAD